MPRWQIVLAVQIIDILVIFAAGVVAFLFRMPAPGFETVDYPVLVELVALVCFLSFVEGRLYNLDALLDEGQASKAAMLRWTVIFATLAAVGSFAAEPLPVSRVWFVSFYVAGGIGLIGARCAGAMLIRRWIGYRNFVKSIVFAGANDLTAKLIGRFIDGRSGIHVAGVFDMGEGRPVSTVQGVKVNGGIDELLAFTKTAKPDLVVLTIPLSDTGRLQKVIARLREQPLDIRIVPGEVAIRDLSASQLSRHELPGVQVLAVGNRPISTLGLLMKETMDRTAAALALVLLAPTLFFAIVSAIAFTSPGPVFFRQPRVGYNGRIFQIFKFRTMHHEFSGSYVPTHKNDPRVHRLGRFLRMSSLDELPQLINVLLGDMSLVGPRPHMIGQKVQNEIFFEDVEGYNARHRVKPGITGWAQINGWRGPAHSLEQIERRVEHDLYYIDNWSIWLDVVILIRTVLFGLLGENAF